MRRLVIVNSVCGIRSTGRICSDIACDYERKGWEVKIAYGREPYVPQGCKKWAIRIGSRFEVYLHALLVRLWGDHGFGMLRSTFATWRFLKWMESWNPEEIWLHNLHGYYINVGMLFAWIKRHPDIQVLWTLHDCWAFTGRCGYFIYSGCEQWKTGCVKCPKAYKTRNQLLTRRCKRSYEMKRRSFCGVKRLRLITPSRWLADLTRNSFLAEYPVEVRNNTIDKNVFCRRGGDFREKRGLLGKFIILGVASTWDARKGLDDFIKLSVMVGEDVRIVLVGLSSRQIALCSNNIIAIPRTNSADELAEMYSTADVFFNPTREDNYPTVNLEARACGCKIVTYDTGGSAETVQGYDKAWILSGEKRSTEGFMDILRTIKEETNG